MIKYFFQKSPIWVMWKTGHLQYNYENEILITREYFSDYRKSREYNVEIIQE